MLKDCGGTTGDSCLFDKLYEVVFGGVLVEEGDYGLAEDFSTFIVAVHIRPSGICEVDGTVAVGNDDTLVGAFGNDAEVM